MVNQLKVIAVTLAIWPSVTAFCLGVNGDSVIRAPAGKTEIVITTTSRLAGAIHSLTWNAKEFINSTDHGRQLQSACSFDNSATANAETFNPTEAGSRRDQVGTNTTSRLLKIVAEKNHLHTETQMAFWLVPGECSAGQLACNTTKLSDYVLTKDVTIGFGRWPQALDYRVAFRVPTNSPPVSAQFEALTGYMPPEFSAFYEFDPATKKLKPLSVGPGEIKNPVVLATPDGKFAMGIYSPSAHLTATRGPSYGRWSFTEARVVKWNCVFRVHQDEGLRRGDYSYHLLVPIGTLAQVEAMLRDWQNANW